MRRDRGPIPQEFRDDFEAWERDTDGWRALLEPKMPCVAGYMCGYQVPVCENCSLLASLLIELCGPGPFPGDYRP